MKLPRASVRFTEEVWRALLAFKEERGLSTVTSAIRAAVIDGLAQPSTPAEVRGFRAGYEDGMAQAREAAFHGSRAFVRTAEDVLRKRT